MAGKSFSVNLTFVQPHAAVPEIGLARLVGERWRHSVQDTMKHGIVEHKVLFDGKIAPT